MLARELLFGSGTPWGLMAAASDPELTASAVRCYLALHDLLDYEGPRAVKIAWLARKARLSPTAASAALAQLVAREYLDQGPDDPPLRTYRLTISPRSRT